LATGFLDSNRFDLLRNIVPATPNVIEAEVTPKASPAELRGKSFARLHRSDNLLLGCSTLSRTLARMRMKLVQSGSRRTAVYRAWP
jgi:hypothetical protein